MKSGYKRDFEHQYFRPLSSFNPSPFQADTLQTSLAKNLHRSYGIPEKNILRLILYADYALVLSMYSEFGFPEKELKEVLGFERELSYIEKITFTGRSSSGEPKSMEITDPHLIDRLYKSMTEYLDLREYFRIKNSNPTRKRSSGGILKKIATELYIELTGKEKITPQRSLYIIGYIFGHNYIGLKIDEPIISEQDFNDNKKHKKDEGLYVSEPSYLQYLAGRIKTYVNWKEVPGNH